MNCLLPICAVLLMATAAQAETIVALDGKVYTSATITRRDATGITVQYDGGVAFLDFANLPAELRKANGYSPVFYEEAMRAKRAKQKNLVKTLVIGGIATAVIVSNLEGEPTPEAPPLRSLALTPERMRRAESNMLRVARAATPTPTPRPSPTPQPVATSHAGEVWVPSYTRNGRAVRGYWRSK